MDSDLAGLRPLAGSGLGLSDCSDLPIHQSKCDKTQASLQRETALTCEEGGSVFPATPAAL